jgi:hypothetical protein
MMPKRKLRAFCAQRRLLTFLLLKKKEMGEKGKVEIFNELRNIIVKENFLLNINRN